MCGHKRPCRPGLLPWAAVKTLSFLILVSLAAACCQSGKEGRAGPKPLYEIGNNPGGGEGSEFQVFVGELAFQLRIRGLKTELFETGADVHVSGKMSGTIRIATPAEEPASLLEVGEYHLRIGAAGEIRIGEHAFGKIAAGQTLEITPEEVLVEGVSRGPFPAKETSQD